jgi:hypothetical protein
VHYPSGVLSDTADHRSLGRSITIGTDKWTAVADRDGGAIYEFYNTRMTDPTLPNDGYATKLYENAVHANVGAALQIALHSGGLGSLDANGCSGQGYWNPTQAGARCGAGTQTTHELSPDPLDSVSNLHITCDGVQNDSCTTASSSVLWDFHRMMNFDYGNTTSPGPGQHGPYPGPYNSGDTLNLKQTIYADHVKYMLVDVTLKNTDSLTRSGALEIPTFYFTSRFRRFYYPSHDDLVNNTVPTAPTFTFPGLPGANDSLNTGILATYINNAPDGNHSPGDFCYDPGWVTAENTFATNNSSATTNQFITLAWFYQPQFLNNRSYTEACGRDGLASADHFEIAEQPYSDQIKVTNAPRIALTGSSTEYNFEYVVFPYKYSDSILTSCYGTHTVAETIALMRTDFLNGHVCHY